ncbi:unnamed protein product [Allacma fusca]|uniref:Uncharacterized protein n=1 Tax=Allacma fusca TaxID=39272 RepID=A0A8J2L2D0_9HEXA|nr:unnamed protein product [Allacma fusca]
MDRNRDRDREKDIKTGNNDKDAKGNRKRLVELDRVVKRAREERSSYWNKRVLEAEEKDPNRWGHSGFKELYRRDMKLGNQGRSNSPLASASNAKTFRRSSPERPRRLLQQDPPRGISARGRNRSKSPPSKSKSRCEDL